MRTAPTGTPGEGCTSAALSDSAYLCCAIHGLSGAAQEASKAAMTIRRTARAVCNSAVCRGKENGMETESLLILPLTRADYDWLCPLYADPEVMRYIGTGVRDFPTASAVLDKTLLAPPPAGYWTLRDRATGEP